MKHAPYRRVVIAALSAITGLSVAALTFAQDAAAPKPVPATSPATLPGAAAPAEAAPGDSAEAHLAAVDVLAKEVAQLAPGDAARRWLELYDRAVKLEKDQADRARADGEFFHADSTNFARLLQALPGPAAWDTLAKAVEARPLPKFQHEQADQPAAPKPKPWEDAAADPAVREFGLRLLAHTLVAKEAGQLEALKALQGYVAKQKTDADSHSSAEQYIEQLSLALTGKAAAPERTLKQFEAQLEAVGSDGTDDVNVPQLVTLLGAEKAEGLLRKALLSRAKLSFGGRYGSDEDDGTRKLARRLATELSAQVKRAPWDLIDVAEVDGSIALYEAMDKRFPPVRGKKGGALLDKLFGRAKPQWEVDQDQRARAEARNTYMVCLIVAGRGDDAATLAAQTASEPADADGGDDLADDGASVAGIRFDYESTNAIAEAADARKVYAALHRLLRDHPALPLWDQFRAASARIGKTVEALALAREVAAKPDLDPAARRAVRGELYKGLLAADEVDEGVAVLRELLKKDENAPAAAPAQGRARMHPSIANGDDRGEHAIALARLGRLLNRPQLVEEGLKVAREILTTPAAENDGSHSYEQQRLSGQYTDLLAQTGRAGEAAQFLSDLIARERAAKAKREADPNNRSWSSYSNDRDQLLTLMGIYHRDGRHGDVREMLDAVPYWNAADLATFYAESGNAGRSAGQMAAAALLADGRTAEARRILDAVLEQSPGADASYELLLRTADLTDPAGAADVLKRLDALFARDQFEERPLIWKAVVLRGQKRADEAEKALRQAIAIDPSDGEQGKGDRMRAYAVLADVLADKGDKKNAAFFRGVVKAIRLSEEADEVYAAGLLSRGVKMYQDSLKHFQDAYCIQSRLAVQLAEIGLTELAGQHYRRAYELMPDSFGRMESHCFGCEGAFKGAKAQSIAEEVFSQMLARHPERPQLHYLLAYLREQQGRHADALPLLRQAVKLDPDYINAWKHLLDLADKVSLPPADADAAMLSLIRLDPHARHGRPDPKGVRDLKALWQAAETASKLQTPAPTKLYPLAASAAELAKAGENAENNPDVAVQMPTYSHGREPMTPSGMVWSTEVMEALKGLIGGD